MIYTKIKYLDHYRGICPNLDRAIEYLAGCGLASLKPGRNEVDGDRIFINRFGYETKPAWEASFEAHDQYLDIHLVIAGRERIGIADRAAMRETDRDEANDGIALEGAAEQYVSMEPGDVLIAFPEDAHQVKVESGGSCQVQKAVVEVLL